MIFQEGLVKARHHIVFIVALVIGSFLLYELNSLEFEQKHKLLKVKKTASEYLPVRRDLTEDEKKAAQVAWQYFENNMQITGLPNSVMNYPSTTLWDLGNYLSALISAHKLEIISDDKFDTLLKNLLTSLITIKLFEDTLPNKAYNTKTLKMVDYTNTESPRGIGYSAIDIGRILIPFRVLELNYPKYTPYIKKILNRWDIKLLSINGELHGSTVLINENAEEEIAFVQEGRLGYEQYAAKLFSAYGVDMSNSIRYDRFLKDIDIYDIEIPADLRDAKGIYEANNYVVMEPYMLDGIELGFDHYSYEFFYRLVKVQEERFKDTKELSAFTEDHIDQAPYFIYNSIFVNGKKWSPIDEEGHEHPDLIQQSTKASFAMYALMPNEYTKKLFDNVKDLYDEKNGFYTGIYEKNNKTNKAITNNTNAVILITLAYIKYGPLYKVFK